ncbi:hypothetical protein BH24PSE2_BH24PSE2_16940 [soil metagenome]
MTAHWKRVIVLDFHSYNHRQEGSDAPPEPQEQNPDVNVGTHDTDLQRWDRVIGAFIEELSACRVDGRRLDVRTNVRFKGGNFPRWIDAVFPNACALAIEVKKIYMDEWSGEPKWPVIHELTKAFRQTIDKLKAELHD